MYRDAYQRGMLTIFFSGGSKPLEIWETKTRDGYIKRFLDPEIKTMVLEIRGHNISTTYISCPKGNQVLGITMPFLVMIVKNLMKYFSFEVTVLDSTGTRRRFRVSNFQSTTQILPLCTVMPIGLAGGWNQIQFNLAEFTRRAYKNQFVEVQRLKINANIRLRRIYFTEKLMSDDELPAEYKLYFPLKQKGPKDGKALDTDKENIISPIQKGIQEKKVSITDPMILENRVLRKSFQAVPIPEEIKGTTDVVTDAKIPKSAADSRPEEGEDKQPSGDAQVTTEKQTIEGKESGAEKVPSPENKSFGKSVPVEIKGDEIEHKKNHESKDDKKSDEKAEKGESDTKPDEGGNDQKIGEDDNIKDNTEPAGDAAPAN